LNISIPWVSWLSEQYYLFLSSLTRWGFLSLVNINNFMVCTTIFWSMRDNFIHVFIRNTSFKVLVLKSFSCCLNWCPQQRCRMLKKTQEDKPKTLMALSNFMARISEKSVVIFYFFDFSSWLQIICSFWMFSKMLSRKSASRFNIWTYGRNSR